MSSQDLIVVIRSAGERTLDSCRELVLRQASEECLHIVTKAPFEAALRRCYEIGMASGARWMMTLDADVLLRDGAIRDLLLAAEQLPEHYFEIGGLLHDKFTGLYRCVGHHMYRTAHLNRALRQIPPPRQAIRPEYTAIARMKELGYPCVTIDKVFGIHDYEQFFGDVYRKAFVHAKKHTKRLSTFVERWQQGACMDDDFRVATRGLHDGLMFTGTTAIDRRDFVEKAATALRDLELSEKNPIARPGIDFNRVSSVLMAVGPVPEDRLSATPLMNETKRLHRLKDSYARLGSAGLIRYSTSAVVSKVGNLFKRKASG